MQHALDDIQLKRWQTVGALLKDLITPPEMPPEAPQKATPDASPDIEMATALTATPTATELDTAASDAVNDALESDEWDLSPNTFAKEKASPSASVKIEDHTEISLDAADEDWDEPANQPDEDDPIEAVVAVDQSAEKTKPDEAPAAAPVVLPPLDPAMEMAGPFFARLDWTGTGEGLASPSPLARAETGSSNNFANIPTAQFFGRFIPWHGRGTTPGAGLRIENETGSTGRSPLQQFMTMATEQAVRTADVQQDDLALTAQTISAQRFFADIPWQSQEESAL